MRRATQLFLRAAPLLPLVIAQSAATAQEPPVAGAPAASQPAPASPTARQQGYGLYREGRYSAAVQKFLLAYEQNKDSDLLYNIAKCYEKMGEYPKALDFYQRYLAAKPNAPDKRDVEAIVAGLKRRLAALQSSISFHSSPTGANVFVDGKFTGTAPLELRLSPGHYEVALELRGHQRAERPLTVRKGADQRVAVVMQRLTGTLKVASNVRDARVILNGKLIGVTPLVSGTIVPEGRHQVVVKKDGFENWSDEVEVQADREQVIYANLNVVERSWSKKAIFGWILLALAAGSEATAWVFYAKGNEQYQGTDEFETSHGLTIGLHAAAGVLAAAGAGLLIAWGVERSASPSEPPSSVAAFALPGGAGVQWQF